MSKNKTRIRFLVICLSFLFHFSFCFSQQVPFKILGDKLPVFHVSIYNADRLMVTVGENFTGQLINAGERTDAKSKCPEPKWNGNPKNFTISDDRGLEVFDPNPPASTGRLSKSLAL